MEHEHTCVECYYFCSVGVKCCDLEKDPTTENTKACKSFEKADS